MPSNTRVFVARLVGLSVFDPIGDQVGIVRDVIVMFSAARRHPRAVGLVVEVPGRRRVFMPMTRVTSMDAGQIISTGLVNLRRFEQRSGEVMVVAELFDRTVTAREPGADPYSAIIEDIAIEKVRAREWTIEKVFVRKVPKGGQRSGFGESLGLRRRRGETLLLDIDQVAGLRALAVNQGADLLLEGYDDVKAADLAEMIRELKPLRRVQVASALPDEKLADVLEELPEDDRVEVLSSLSGNRAADVLEAMQPDDAADLLGELTPDAQERYLRLMEPDDAEDLRRLLVYEEDTAGGLMTTEPLILPPEATVAEALAYVRRQEIPPALAAAVFVCRAPQETPTGKYLGLVHFQRLLREPPTTAIGSALDTGIEPVCPSASLMDVTRELATYNMMALPVADEDGHLLGAVSVDDVIDKLLPNDWRDDRHEVTHG
ncbi:magnesium transporter MgtE N-terminal domain-containing protein [Dermatophilus congolensis]|uniref:Magnesium transporter mgtE n=1 Tax=Dermatophilus congolensis TaxID=1863 RepID=A0AA46BNK1_9MICO|nr:CBS domain-containing protein [Dermatophilus congolensis]MBO3129688.1 magnesium transporter [Dermatophilus congolensis]MBO3131682.1 magnesium transporter [Dermatophilus congolensis]MBO3134163.1 magnesium transporter [Dermatophilus congolensis]MBO3136396.1 magnesium transporter [Dermatophilus congolensis]MBO3138645.1 magnesium transporter [Dermatophilus congolensis]